MQRLALVFLSALLIFWAFPPSTAASRLRKFCIVTFTTVRASAEEECRRKYINLVTVYDHQDNMELAKLLNSGPSGWIGASIGENKKEKWSNGDEVTFNRLNGDCGETCCATMNADGAWESIKCSEKKHFMCYKQVIDGGQESYDYSLIREDKTWIEAQLFCRENYNDLASIRNEEENEEVMKKRGDYTSLFWIGLLVDGVEWADGGQSAYRNWEPQHLDKLGAEVYMDNKGKWKKAEKNGGEYFPLCYRSLIHVSTDEKTWEEALDYCNSDDKAGLLTIQSQSDQTEIEEELKKQNISGPMWVGLRQSRLFGFWIWNNGVTVGSFTNWKGGSQPGHQMSHHCGAIEEENGQYKWTDKDCRSELRVLCEGNRVC